MENED